MENIHNLALHKIKNLIGSEGDSCPVLLLYIWDFVAEIPKVLLEKCISIVISQPTDLHFSSDNFWGFPSQTNCVSVDVDLDLIAQNEPNIVIFFRNILCLSSSLGQMDLYFPSVPWEGIFPSGPLALQAIYTQGTSGKYTLCPKPSEIPPYIPSKSHNICSLLPRNSFQIVYIAEAEVNVEE